MNTEQRQTGWIGVDLDGTLAHYDGWKGPEHIGEPIHLMVARVKQWLAEGKDVRIMTARVSYQACTINQIPVSIVRQVIQQWCQTHIGRALDVTCSKDLDMIELWDDRCVQVVPNTGKTLAEFCNTPLRGPK